MIKKGQQSRMKITKLKKRNGLLDVNLAWRKLAKVEIEQKLKETVKRLKITKENNSKLHTIIFEIDRQGEEL